MFRAEVMHAQQSQWLGEIRIARPLSFALVTAAAVACGLALAAFSVFGSYTRKATVSGLLQPASGVMNLSSPQSATVIEVLAQEGDVVERGQPLLRLNSDRTLDGGELSRLQMKALQDRRTSLLTELTATEQQVQQRSVA